MAQHPLPSSHEVAGLQLSVFIALAETHGLPIENRSAPQLRLSLNTHVSTLISSTTLDDGTLISSLSTKKMYQALSEYGFGAVEAKDAPRYLAAA